VGRAAALGLACTLLALAGCGGQGGQGGSSTAEAAKPTATKSKTEAPAQTEPKSEPSPGPPAVSFQPKPHHDSGGGSEQFIAPGGDNSVQEFGAEAQGSEFKAPATALHDLLDARAQRNWAAACRYLSKGAKQGLAQLATKVPQLKGAGCAADLGALTGTIAAAKLREATIADVASVRVKGEQAFLIYRGAQGQVEAVAAVREGGVWKVASLGAVPLG
jgi:hypothetical protein